MHNEVLRPSSEFAFRMHVTGLQYKIHLESQMYVDEDGAGELQWPWYETIAKCEDGTYSHLKGELRLTKSRQGVTFAGRMKYPLNSAEEGVAALARFKQELADLGNLTFDELRSLADHSQGIL